VDQTLGPRDAVQRTFQAIFRRAGFLHVRCYKLRFWLMRNSLEKWDMRALDGSRMWQTESASLRIRTSSSTSRPSALDLLVACGMTAVGLVNSTCVGGA